jgi:2-keto-4-pentenoate hydratase/2-oxohepta-3-ene-1,7-dioic acid hydratase in catechol pathway
MRIATFKPKDKLNGAPRIGVVTGSSVIDLAAVPELLEHTETWSAGPPSDALSVIRSFSNLRPQLEVLLDRSEGDSGIKGAQFSLDSVELCAPVQRPGKLLCLAGNYRDHITESGFVVPEQTDVITQQIFLKPSTCIIGNEEEILIEHNNVLVGWETELAVVIGKRGKHIPAEKAYDFVFGYTILNDVTERRLNSRLQNRRKRELDTFFDWLGGKWFDTFAPCGPWVVTMDEIVDPHDLEIKLTINGELRQHGNTRDMIFNIPEQIAYISSIMTLEPGDIISTGTPAGAGIGGDTSLHDGDELVCEIEKIGTLRNRVRYLG